MVKEVSAASPSTSPVLACFLGRQRIGKSVAAWALAETWPADRKLQVWDFDPAVNQEDGRTLSWLMPSALKPDKAHDQGRTDWLRERIDAMIGAHLSGSPFDVICDFGGVEETVKRFLGQFSLVQSLESVGLCVSAIHVIGPEIADLRFLSDVETSGVFRPKLAAAVMNEKHLSLDESPQEAFQDVAGSPVAKQFAKRGGKFAFMPYLFQMPRIIAIREKKGPISLRDAAVQSADRLGFLDAWKVKEWLEVKVPALRKQLEGCLP